MSRGWTLIELVITIGLMGLLAIPLGNLFSEVMSGSLEDQEQAQVLNLARFQLEEVNSLPYGRLDPGTVTLPTYQGFPYDVQREIAVQSPTDLSGATNMRRITVRVFRGGTTAPPLVQLITYRTNGVSSGS